MTHPEEETTSKIKSECIDLCYDCRIKQGFERNSNYVGIAKLNIKSCSACFEKKPIINSGAWRLK